MWNGDVDLVQLGLVCFLLFSLTSCEKMMKKVRRPLPQGVSNDTIRVFTTPKGPVSEGATVQMTCEAEGYPDPDFLWGKILDNGTVLWSNRSWTTGPLTGTQPDDQANSLTLQNVDKDIHGGVYVCVAQNTVNSKTHMAMKSIKLTVVSTMSDFKRNVNPILWAKTMRVNEGDEGLGIFSYMIPTFMVGLVLVIATMVAYRILVPGSPSKIGETSENGDQSSSRTLTDSHMFTKGPVA